MATKTIPATVSRVVLAQGAVHVRATRDAVEAGLALGVGEDRSFFTEIADDAIARFGFPLEYRPGFEADALGQETGNRAAGSETPRIEPMLNALEDWTLEDHATLQFRLLQKDSPVRFDLMEPIHLPPHKGELEFNVLLGAHRAAARLRLRIEEADGTEVQEINMPFDAAFHGGVHFQGYREITRTLPAHPDGPTVLKLSVLYDHFTGAADETEPYLFVADPHVRRKARKGAVPAEELYRNPGAEKKGQIWASAPLPALLEPGQDLVLITGSNVTTLKTGASVRLRLVEDHGHTIKLSASEAGRYQFQIDGKFAFKGFIGTESTAIRIPHSYFDGQMHQLSATDDGGTQRLFSTWLLLPRILTPFDVMQVESRAPFPGPIAVQAAHRYAGLKAHMQAGHEADRLAGIAHALSVLEGGPRNVKLKPMAFPDEITPLVSVVIPAHNKVEVTWMALASLLLAHNEASFEVILVDDASTDATAEIESLVSGITVIRNEVAQRFIRACNSGAAVARGQFVCLLNNDVEVTAGWLDEMVAAFDRFPNVGLTGSKLIYPDGRLQDAGGIVWGSGNPWQYGNGQNPWDPRFCYARQVDYLSGAAMMTRKEIWDELGGLSDYLEPMYFEDTDFAFKVREAGYSTWFVPSSVVYHYEGVTSGTDTKSGFKRFQEMNQPKFKRRWAQAFRDHGREDENVDLEKDRGILGRVLFIDYATPRPDQDAGSYAAIQEIRLVQSLGYKVTFLPQNLAHLGSYTETLEKMGVEMIHAPFTLSVADFLERRASEFEAIYITRYYVAQNLVAKIRDVAPRAKILFNNADLHFLRELRAGLAANDPGKVVTAAETRTRELEVMRSVDVVLSYNEAEHAIIESHTDGEVTVARCPWVVDLPDEVAPREGRSGISFLGNYRHLPNAEGAAWFVRQVMPLVNAADPGLVLWLYGSAMTDEVKALASGTVQAQGFVEDLADAYNRHRIFVAPLLSGAGIKGKVLSALSWGIPCILSPIAAEGIGLRHGLDCMIARTPQDWAEAVGQLATDDALWDRISGNARSYVAEEYSFVAGRRRMRAAFEAADIFSALAD